MDLSKYLVLYSGGADSTHLVETEPTARYLLHYESPNPAQTRIARINANILNRYLEIIPLGIAGPRDGETNQIHALFDTEMALNASIRAAHYGMKGIVLGFNANDIGIDVQSLKKIMRRAEPKFEILQPLIDKTGKEIRAAIKRSSKLRFVSCMHSESCGYCAKCTKKY